MFRTHAALIVDSDPKGLESLVYGFQGAGWRITACPAPETAPLLVKASAAQLIVTSSRADHDKVHAMIKLLRSREAHRRLPVLVLGPEELRPEVKQHGHTELLPLPTFVRDVLSASQLLVASDGSAAAKPGDHPVLEHALSAQASLSLVRTMSGLRRSGSLHLARKGRHGEILFHEGELTGAQVGPLQGMAAVQHLLVWNDGHLELRLRPVVRRGQFHRTAQEFLEQFERFQRDYSHAIKDIGPPSTVYLVNQDRLRASTGAIPAEVTPVIRLCDGQRNLADVIDESPFRVLDTVRILGRLVELAVLSRRDPRPEERPDAAGPLEAFWATARITLGGAAQYAARLSQPMLAQVEDASMQKTPSPVETKPRTRRDTLEIGTPARSATHAPQPITAVVLTGAATGEAQASLPREDVASARAIDVPRHSTPAFGTEISREKSSPPRGVPVVKEGPATNTQTSGTFEFPQARGSQTTVRPSEPRRSVVIDTALVEAVAMGQAANPAGSAADVPPAPTPPAQTPVPPASTEPADVAKEPSSTSGTSENLSTAAGVPIVVEMNEVPSRPTMPPSQPTPSVSVELRRTPTDEGKTPPVARVPLADVKQEAPGARVTGEMRVVSSGKSRVPIKVGVTSSFQIDPSLTLEAPTSKTESRGHSTPGPLPRQGDHRPSGSFSAIESDFFEREADLYKVDKSESFADLDEKKGKPAGRNKTAAGPAKRR